MATHKLLLGLGMTVMLLGSACARPGFVYLVGACAQPVEPGGVGRTADIARADEALALSPDLDGASSSRADEALALLPDFVGASSPGATTAPTSEQ